MQYRMTDSTYSLCMIFTVPTTYVRKGMGVCGRYYELILVSE